MKNLLAAMLVALAGCGGSDNNGNGIDLSRFVGLWNGTSVVTANGQTTSASGFTHITANGSDLSIGDVCANGTGPGATPTSATAFSIHAYACPPIATTSCSSVVLSTTGGTGSVSGTTLTMTLPGTVAGCGTTGTFSIAFTGAK